MADARHQESNTRRFTGLAYSMHVKRSEYIESITASTVNLNHFIVQASCFLVRMPLAQKSTIRPVY